MIEQATARASRAPETTQGAREASAAIPQSDVRELERILAALGEEGRELISSPDKLRAIVTVPNGSGAVAVEAVTSRGVADTLLALGWARRIPAGPGAQLRRDQISAKGRAALANIERGNRRLAQIEAPDPAPAPVSSRDQLRAEIMALPEAERLDYALDLLDEFIGEAPDIEAGWRALGVRLTAPELRVAGRMAADRDRLVARAVLQRVLGDPSDPGDFPGAEALRAAMARLRRKLRAAGLPIEIEATPGRGYAMRAPASFEIPGQGEGVA